MIRLFVAAVALAWSCQLSTVSAQFLPIELGAIFPNGCQAGQEVEVAITAGTRLEEANRLVFSHPGISAEVKTVSRPWSETPVQLSGQFVVRVAADVPPGRYDVRVVGRHGVSNPRLFVVTNLPTRSLPAASHQSSTPTLIEANHVIATQAAAAAIDYYQFELESPRAVAVRLAAQQIDSRLIGALELWDAEGKSISARHGADQFDPELQVAELPPGRYLLGVHDFLYRGGPEFFYHLAIQTAEAQAMAADVPPSPFDFGPDLLSQSAGVTTQLAPDHQVEPVGQLQRLELPHLKTWWFAPGFEDNLFEFAGQKGQRLALEVLSQRLGQPSDARLILSRVQAQDDAPPQLHRVVTVEDSQAVSDGVVKLHSSDPATVVTLPETATYQLLIRDLDVGEALRPRQKFALRVAPPEPRFTLVAYRSYPHADGNQARPFGSKLFRGGTESVRVLAIRHDGWSGPIELSVEGLPPGVVAHPAVIAANQHHAQITLQAGDEAEDAVVPVRIRGRSVDGQLEATAVPLALSISRGHGREFLQSRRVDSLVIGVSSRDVSPLTIKLAENGPITVKKGEKASLPVEVVRREGGGQPIVLRPRDLPPGVTAGEVTNAADANQLNLEITATPNAQVGTYTIWLQAETTVKLRPNPQALAEAESRRSHLQSLRSDAQNEAHFAELDAAIAEAEKLVQAAQPQAAEQTVTVFVPTTVATIQIVDP